MYHQLKEDNYCGALWFWMNGNITKEGISADMKAMGMNNVKKALIYPIGNEPAGPVAFMSDEWIDLFAHSVKEANRNGVEIGLQSGPGWCGSGGPWITLEFGMQTITLSETLVSGNGLEQTISLPKPRTNLNYYHDSKVIAYPSGKTMQSEKAHLSASQSLTPEDETCLMDGQSDAFVTLLPANPRYIEIRFPQNETVYGMRLTHAMPDYSRNVEYGNITCSGGEIQVEEEGSFRGIGRFELGAYGEFNIGLISEAFPPTTGKTFRVLFDQADGKAFQISEVELIFQPVLSDWMTKAGYYTPRAGDNNQRYEWHPDRNEMNGNILLKDVIDLTGKMSDDGILTWSVPIGNWRIVRMGHTASGIAPRPIPDGIATSLESDKLSIEATRIHYENYFGRLIKACGTLTGKSFSFIETDSWEVGAQNWTASLPKEFQKRRGYDLTPYLPVLLAGRIVESKETSERFLEDFRHTLQELLLQNYFKTFTDLAHKDGLKFWAESYHSMFAETLDIASEIDVAMAEFWGNYVGDLTALSWIARHAQSGAQTYGINHVPAEAFTSDFDRWTLCPKEMKNLGDLMYTSGINQFVFHRYAHQPWLDKEPGMTMGRNGTHFERTNTWWNQGKAWLDYLSRCQGILQQGKGAGDVIFLQPEYMPMSLSYTQIMQDKVKKSLDVGYGYIFMTQGGFAKQTKQGNTGTIELPLGTGYSVIVMPDYDECSVEFLTKVRELVKGGAVVVASVKPSRAPGLDNEANAQVRRLVDELFGILDGIHKKKRSYGKGIVTLGMDLEEVLNSMHLVKDFDYIRQNGSREPDNTKAANIREVNYFHRVINGEDVYFIANRMKSSRSILASFRATKGSPEIYDPLTTQITHPAVWKRNGNIIKLPLSLGPEQSLFVSFRMKVPQLPVRAFLRNGKNVLHVISKLPDKAVMTTDSFTMSGWFKPEGNILLAQEQSIACGPDQPYYDIYPVPGHEVFGVNQYGAGLSVGNNGIAVTEHGAGQFANVLVYKADLPHKWTHVAVVYRNHKPELYVNGILVHTGQIGLGKVRTSIGVKHSRAFISSQGENEEVRAFNYSLSPQEIALQSRNTPVESADTTSNSDLFYDAKNILRLETDIAGDYSVKLNSGNAMNFNIKPKKPLTLSLPWQVQFVSGRGAPGGNITFPSLSDWSLNSNEGIKYYSGTAIYKSEFVAPKEWFDAKQKLILDLGEVDIISDVEINGKNLGTLWYSPFKVDVTSAVKPGANTIKAVVTNNWVNRIIGDLRNPDKKQYTYSNTQLYKADDVLQPSGLIGPVRIIPTASIQIK